jgi:hypothetical protein
MRPFYSLASGGGDAELHCAKMSPFIQFLSGVAVILGAKTSRLLTRSLRERHICY